MHLHDCPSLCHIFSRISYIYTSSTNREANFLHAFLSSIRSNGLAIDAEIGKPMKIRQLKEPPDFDMNVTDKPVRYLPTNFNYRAIDGIIILIKAEKNAKEEKEGNAKPKKPKLFMFPLQITVASYHSDSHAKFFEGYYRKWTKVLSSAFDVVPEFLWITPKQHGIREHPECSKWPAHKERYIPLMEVSEKIWTRYQHAEELLDEAQAGLAR